MYSKQNYQGNEKFSIFSRNKQIKNLYANKIWSAIIL